MKGKRILLGLAGAFCLLLAVRFASSRMWVRIEPGHAGVIDHSLSSGNNAVEGEGVHLVAPWKKVTRYDLRFQQTDIPLLATSKDGITLPVAFSLRYQPNRHRLLSLHGTIGPEYVQRLLIPKTQAIAGRMLNQYSWEEIYATRRSEIQDAIEKELRKACQQWLVIDDFWMKEVQLPEALKAAFETAAVEQQKKEAMRARMVRELGESMAAPAEAAPPAKKEFEFKPRGDMGGLNLPPLEEILPKKEEGAQASPTPQ